MKNRNHGLSEKEIELVKLLMADCESTGDIQAKLKKSCLQERLSICLKLRWTNISDMRKTLFSATIPATAETVMARKLSPAITANAKYPYPVTAMVNLSLKSSKKDRLTQMKLNRKSWQCTAKGMSQRDIEDTLREIYGAEISQGLVSRITDKILPEVNDWQNRPLDKIYPVVFFDGIVFNSRKDNKIISKCVYSVLGINMEGQKEILGTWISENESASFYASICSDLKNRGVTDIFIACHDNLTGLCDAINAIFPRTKNQLCIVHQIRNSCKFVPYKDRKAVCADLKKIYGAVNLDGAEYAKEEFRENMGMDLQTNPKVSQHLKILG